MTNTARDHSTYRAARRQAARAMYRAAPRSARQTLGLFMARIDAPPPKARKVRP